MAIIIIYTGEWISGATCMYLANQLVEKYNEDDRVGLTSYVNQNNSHVSFICFIKVTNLLKEVEFIFVPFVNPDGYEVCNIVTHTTDAINVFYYTVHLD